MILLIATVCLLADPVTASCSTNAMRVEQTPIGGIARHYNFGRV